MVLTQLPPELPRTLPLAIRGNFLTMRQRNMDTHAGFPLETAGSQLVLLHRISGIVSSSLALKEMLDKLIGLVAAVTNCDACLVYLLDESAGEIVLCASQLPH